MVLLINDISSGDKAGEELYTDSHKKIRRAIYGQRLYMEKDTAAA